MIWKLGDRATKCLVEHELYLSLELHDGSLENMEHFGPILFDMMRVSRRIHHVCYSDDVDLSCNRSNNEPTVSQRHSPRPLYAL